MPDGSLLLQEKAEASRLSSVGVQLLSRLKKAWPLDRNADAVAPPADPAPCEDQPRSVAETVIKENEIRFRLPLEAAGIGVYEFDYEAWTLKADRRTSEIVGGVLPAEVAVSMNGPELTEFARRVHREDQDAYWNAAVSIRSGASNSFAIEFRWQHPDGSWRWLKARGAAFNHPSGARWLYNIVMDITATVEIEERLERLVHERTRALTETACELRAEMERRELVQATLAQTQKMEALGQLTSGIVHDCNNNLSIIVSVLALIRKKTSDNAIQLWAAAGEKAVARTTGLFEHLLAFARRETVKPARIDLNSMLSETKQLVRHSVGSQVNLMVKEASDLWSVVADKNRLEVALLNLATNARDAMPRGGTLSISAQNLPADAPRAEACPQGDCVVISVGDTGTGMPPDVLTRALEPFYTTKGVGKGTGLGLAMVHSFANESNGGLAIRTAQNEGTVIDIFLPRNETAGTDDSDAALAVSRFGSPPYCGSAPSALSN